MGGFAWAVGSTSGFDARLLRGRGAPFSITATGKVNNSFRLRLVNRSTEPQQYTLAVTTPENVKLDVLQDELLKLEPGGNELIQLNVEFPPIATRGSGSESAILVVEDGQERKQELPFMLLGPR